MNIADRIQHLRKTKGISQEELADKIGVSRQSVSKWESEQSLPDIDKVIILSDFFEVTTDYILKGIETKTQMGESGVNANIFVIIATALNFIGLLIASALWYEEQAPMAIVAGLILMAVGGVVFGIGHANSTQNAEKAKRLFWTINIWILAFIPPSLLYNMLLTGIPAPYPMLVFPLFALPAFWLVYLAICLSVVFLQIKRKHR
ncbi:MAG: helix-turn-helix domain-containing protein [Oscillospiraceae bacterium]|nr:helix-turn-helix domain-containing protein [Oscillospiraceae bacterium]